MLQLKGAHDTDMEVISCGEALSLELYHPSGSIITICIRYEYANGPDVWVQSGTILLYYYTSWVFLVSRKTRKMGFVEACAGFAAQGILLLLVMPGGCGTTDEGG